MTLQYVMDKFSLRLILIISSLLLSACVTQNFENDDTPVVENEASRNDKAITRISLGLGYLKMGNMTQAKLNLEKAKQHAPNLVQVYTAFAHYYEKVGEQKLTVEAYEKAISIKADDADTLNNYGVYLCRQDQIGAAEKQFLKAIAVPSYLLVAQSYENLAMCQLKADDFIKAELYLNKAILHSPASASTLSQMISVQYAMGNYRQAKTYVQRFEKATRRFSAQSLALAYKVNVKLKQRQTARNYGAMLVKMYPQSWESKQYLLNSLERIDADVLAERYQKIDNKNVVVTKKKRVVVLSPNKPNKYLYSKKYTAKKKMYKKSKEKQFQHADIEQLPTTQKASVVSQAPNNKPLNTITEQKTSQVNDAVIQSERKVTSETTVTTHVVVKGDNLYIISVKYNVHIKALRRWNKFSETQRIYIGDKVYIVDPSTLENIND